MDKKFLEFWGNLLLNAAKGQEQMEEMAKWVRQGFKGFEQQQQLFQKFYGLEGKSKADSEYIKMWTTALADFQKSLTEYMNLLGVVPKSEYQALHQKCQELEKKVAEQEETIRQLKITGADTWSGQEELTKAMQDLVTKQGEQFRELMNNFSRFYEEGRFPKKEET